MHIELKEFDPGIGKEYLSQEYPGVGAYLNKRMNYIFMVYRPPASNVPCTTSFPATGLVSNILPPAEKSTGISEDFILKALAIAQDPTLAELLVKRN